VSGHAADKDVAEVEEHDGGAGLLVSLAAPEGEQSLVLQVALSLTAHLRECEGVRPAPGVDHDTFHNATHAGMSYMPNGLQIQQHRQYFHSIADHNSNNISDNGKKMPIFYHNSNDITIKMARKYDI
jgi:hypothetical protein